MEGNFKTLEQVTIPEDHQNKPKFNLVCIGNVKDSKTRVAVSEKIPKRTKMVNNCRDKNMGLLVQFSTTFTSHLICTQQP